MSSCKRSLLTRSHEHLGKKTSTTGSYSQYLQYSSAVIANWLYKHCNSSTKLISTKGVSTHLILHFLLQPLWAHPRTVLEEVWTLLLMHFSSSLPFYLKASSTALLFSFLPFWDRTEHSGMQRRKSWILLLVLQQFSRLHRNKGKVASCLWGRALTQIPSKTFFFLMRHGLPSAFL